MDPSQSPQQPSYPAYAPTSAPLAAAPAPKKGGAGRIIAVVVVLVVIALAALGYVHYNGPASTVKSFYTATLVNFDASAAYGAICSDAKDRPTSVADMQQEIDSVKAVGKFDISGLTYTTSNENFFSDATVKLGGTVKATVAGQPVSAPLTDTVTLKSSGLGWCIEGGATSATGTGFSGGLYFAIYSALHRA